jgi:hypothetical protein
LIEVSVVKRTNGPEKIVASLAPKDTTPTDARRDNAVS